MRRSEDGPEVTRLLELAVEALDEGDADAALARADEALARSPRSVAALQTRAEALVAAGRIDDALDAYDRALAEGKGDPEVLLGAADLLVNRLGDDERDRADLERGYELARTAAKRARRAGDDGLLGEAAWVEGAALTQLGRADEALPRLDEAAALHFERGIALYELLRWDEAREALLRAEAAAPDDPWTQHQLGLVEERRQDAKEARRRFERARALAPDDFPAPLALSRPAFDRAVEEALAGLPDRVRQPLANVAITVEDLPSEEDLRAAVPPLSPGSLGMFRGPAYGRGGELDPVTHLPSSIVLFQRNLERFARSREELADEISVTLIHEVGHFLGLDEDELYERGLD